MYFPPSFFDIIVHLIVRLIREIKSCGPIYLRWMYPAKRYMKILKGYIKNLHYLEASIVERNIAEEDIKFCSEYIKKTKHVGCSLPHTVPFSQIYKHLYQRRSDILASALGRQVFKIKTE